MKRLISILFLVVVSPFAKAEVSERIIALPAKQYLLEGVNNPIFVQTFTKYDTLDGDIIRFEGESVKGGVLAKSANIKSPKSGDTLTVKLYDGKTFDVKESHTSVICAGDPKVGRGEVRVQFLGDSFTKGCYFLDAFLTKGYVPGVKLIGTKLISEHEGQYHEGRGGWTVAKYFSNNVESDNLYNPFYQPTGELRYWGAVEFWKTSVLINKSGGGGLPFSVRYNQGGCNTSRFGDDGFLLSPKRGDVMYNRNEYVEWSGKSWKRIDEPKEWGFDYAKYLKMWELDAPQFLVVMLGLNDFRDESMPLDFGVWNERIEIMLSSYRAAVPQGRLLLSTPCTSCGTLDNDRGFFTTRQNAMMWRVRQNVIDIFDCREAEGIYVVDGSAAIDNENGYKMKGGVQTGNPHPYLSYPQLGVPIAACVQYYRDK